MSSTHPGVNLAASMARPHPALVFIMGDHRSGTTLLYQLLAETGAFNVLTAYHIINYDRLLANHAAGRTDAARRALAARFAALGITNRKLDGVRVSPDLPEEYGFLLNDSPRPQLTSQNLPRLWAICRTLQAVAGAERPLLLKNPWDYFGNFRFVKEVLPDAQFIFLLRDPVAVVNSQLRAVRDLMREPNCYAALLAPWYARLLRQPTRRATLRWLFSAELGLGVRITTRHVAQAFAYHVANLPVLPPGDHLGLRFEDLCAAPERWVSRILTFTRAQPRQALDNITQIDPRPPVLLPDVARHACSIRRKTRAYRAWYGY